MVWKSLDEIKDKNLLSLMGKIHIRQFYDLQECTEGNIKFYILSGDNEFYFKAEAEIGVNLIVVGEGVKMPDNHPSVHFKEEYSVPNAFMSNVFCTFSMEEAEEKIEYIKNNIKNLTML